MYARNATANIYHLVTKARSETLCGVPVVPLVIDRPAETSSLHLTSQKPLDRALCVRCEIISNEEDVTPAAR